MKISCTYCGTSSFVPERLALGVARELRCVECRSKIVIPLRAAAGAPARVELFHGRYEKLGPPTLGGQGLVYPAYDRTLRTFVAVKELSSSSLLARFEQEFAVGSQLTHENIVRLHDHGQSRDVRYLTMEYLEGDSLESLLSAGAIPYERAIDYLVMACEGLEYVHLKGLVHRDLKPANMFVTSDGILKLMDFGSATSESDASDASDKPDEPEVPEVSAPGTRGYMAPEQVLSPSTVTQQADLWSLGAIAYQLLTGRIPYPELDEREAAREGRLPVAPSSLNPRVPVELDALVLHALAGRPENRLPDVSELCERLMALRRKLQAQPAAATAISSVRPGAPAPAPQLSKARLAMAGVALALVLGAVTLLLRGPARGTANATAVVATPSVPAAAIGSSGLPGSASASVSAPQAARIEPAALPATPSPANQETGPQAQLRASTCAAGTELVPAGELQLAHPRPRAWTFAEGSLPTVRLEGFCIDPHPVSVAAHARCVAEGSCQAHSDLCTPSSDPAAPMKCVSWLGAQQYCAARGGELPTIAQWEAYAAASSAPTASSEWARDTFPPAVFAASCGEPGAEHCQGHMWRKAGRLPIVDPDRTGRLEFSWNRGADLSASGHDYVSFRCVRATVDH